MTAANLPGGPGTAGADASPPQQANLPEPSPIATQPDMNGGQPGAGGPSDLGALPPVAPLEPMSTKPRQIPGGEASSPGGPQMPGLPGMVPGMESPMIGQPGGSVPGAPQQFDPNSSGMAQQSTTPDQPQGDAPKTSRRIGLIAAAKRDNPNLSLRAAWEIAVQAERLLDAEANDPLAVVEP